MGGMILDETTARAIQEEGEAMRQSYLDGLQSLWTKVSFRALVRSSELFAGDEWEPIDRYGALPFASHDAAMIARDLYRKRTGRGS